MKAARLQIPQVFILCMLAVFMVAAFWAGIPVASILGDSLVRLVMNGVLVMSMVPMLNAGLGVNFGLPVGICAGLLGLCIAVNFRLTGMAGLMAAMAFSVPIGTILGYLYGKLLHRVSGREEIAGTFVGFSFISIMNFFWATAPFTNPVMLWPIGGHGLRPVIGLQGYFAKVLNHSWVIYLGKLAVPAGMLLFFVVLGLLLHLFFKTRAGLAMKAVGENQIFAGLSGVNVQGIRIAAVVISTIMAAWGICVYAQSYGFIELYSAPLMMAFPAASAIFLSGSLGRKTGIIQAAIGTFLFQTTYVISGPIANAFLVPEVAEIIRMILTNGIILYAMIYEGAESAVQRFSPVPALFLVLSALALYYSGLSISFVAGEVVTRFIRDGVMVLALVIPVTAGMGLNFAITVGALAAQVGLILAVDWGLQGGLGLLAITSIGLVLSLVLGYLIGLVLNRVKGKEMIATMIIGFLATGIYQLIFMVGYGTFIRPTNHDMMLSRGIGIRNMVDLKPFRNIIDTIWVIQAGTIEIPVFMILVVLTFAGIIAYIMNTRLGQQFKAVGEGIEKARMLGIDTDSVRIKAIVLSTVLACMGHIIFTQNIGMLNVYTAHMNTDIFACAALLAGGASILRARVSHALVGVLLFHSLFIVSPQAGQNIFSNAALGEYFRTFVAYGTIAFALVMSTRREEGLL